MTRFSAEDVEAFRKYWLIKRFEALRPRITFLGKLAKEYGIGHVDASGVDSIDDWIDLLDEQTPLMVVNSSGTTGKLSFYPRAARRN